MLHLYPYAQLLPTTPFADFIVMLVAWLSGPSFSIMISQWLENISQFKALSSMNKQIVSTVLTALGTIAGYLLGSSAAVSAIPQNSPAIALALVALSYAITQVYHAVTKPPSAITTTTIVPDNAKSTTTTTETTTNPPGGGLGA